MKKLLLMTTFMVLFTSCSLFVMNQGVKYGEPYKVVNITNSIMDSGLCAYDIKTVKGNRILDQENNIFHWVDSCGKYTVGEVFMFTTEKLNN